MQTYIASCVAALSDSAALYNVNDLNVLRPNEQISFDCHFISTGMAHRPNQEKSTIEPTLQEDFVSFLVAARQNPVKQYLLCSSVSYFWFLVNYCCESHHLVSTK